MRNIKQLTNFDVDYTTTPIPKAVQIGKNTKIINYYKIPYAQLLGVSSEQASSIQIDIDKFGYCVNDNQGINYPIYINFKDDREDNEICFYIGKTGMFESQPEEWTDVNENIMDNDTETITRTAFVSIDYLLVPENVPFVLDYSFKV